MTNHEKYDVVICGAGIAGCAATISLGQFNFKTLLIDKRRTESFRVGEGLSPACNDLLKKLGLWEEFILQKHLPSYGNASAWGDHKLNYQDFLMQGNGWHIDRSKFDRLFLDNAKKYTSDFKKDTFIQKIEQFKSGDWILKLKNQNSDEWVTTKFLIDATGRSSSVSRKLGFKKIIQNRILCFWKIFKPSNKNTDRESLTLIEAVREGWWYTALLPSGHRIVVFFTVAKSLISKQLSKNNFFHSLLHRTTHIKSRLINYESDPKITPKASATESAYLSRLVDKNWLAIGDAGMSFDPISSQGIPNAIYSGMTAADAIGRFLNGVTDSLDNYNLILSGIWERYEERIAALYSQELRWPENAFWKEKQMVRTLSP